MAVTAPEGGAFLRLLTPADLPAAMALKEAAGWNQTAADWETFLKLAPDGCFALEAGGRVAATSTALPYDGSFGWVGMVLVHPDARRRGHGTALLLAAVDALEKRRRVAALDATPEGKAVYDRHGFRELLRLHRRVGIAPAGMRPHAGCRPIAAADLPAILSFDAACFGAGRGGLLREIFGRAPDLALVMDGSGGLEGYIASRRGSRFNYIGPWVARSENSARALLETALSRLEGQPAGFDIFRDSAAAGCLADRFGFRAERELIRMVRGDAAPGGPADGIFGIAGPEFG